MKQTKFEMYDLKPFIIEAVHHLGFMSRLIFKAVNPCGAERGERDRAVADRYGKTHAYLLPL
ncbi:hypothetical protein PO124_08155 [Bacillus licheniformis]|nr:hypothetical protein [Bacillus licheniformis]